MKRLLILTGILAALCLPLAAQNMNPQAAPQLAQNAMARERWDEAARWWQVVLEQRDWPYTFPRENALLSQSTCLQRLSRWEVAHDLLLAYLREHPIQSASTVKMTGHLAAIAYGKEGEAGLDRLLDHIIGSPTHITQFTTFYLNANADMGGPYPLDGAITRFLRAHPVSPAAQTLRAAQLGLLNAGGDCQEAWNRAQQWYMDGVGTAADVNLIRALCDTSARVGAPDNAVQLLTQLMPVTPDPGKALPPLLAQYRTQAEKMAGRRTQIEQVLPAALDDAAGTTEKDRVVIAQLSGGVPGAVYRVAATLQDYLAAHPDHPRRQEVILTMARQLSLSGDHKAAIDLAQPLLPAAAGTREETGVALFLAEEHARRGDFRGAGDLLLKETSKELADNVNMKTFVLRYYRRAGAAQEAAAVLTGLGPNPPAHPTVIDTAYWLAAIALDAGKAQEVKPWCDLLQRIAPNDIRTATVRALLMELQNRPK